MNMSYVCFNITSNCNMKCPYCYRVGDSLENISLKKAKEYIIYLIEHGCRTINITGGEPLVNNQWRDIVEFCAEKGLFIILSSNGLTLDLDDVLLRHIKVLSLPLDGANMDTNCKTRSKEHFNKIISLLNKYISGSYPFKLKINTVLTGYNYRELNDMLLLLNSNKIVWKIFELREKGCFYDFPKDKVISSEDVDNAMKRLQLHNHKCSIYFMGKKSEISVKPNYIVLNYNGDVYLADEVGNKFLFNIDDKPDSGDFKVDLLNNQYYEELKNDFK